jgi:hypothetical protein
MVEQWKTENSQPLAPNHPLAARCRRAAGATKHGIEHGGQI